MGSMHCRTIIISLIHGITQEAFRSKKTQIAINFLHTLLSSISSEISMAAPMSTIISTVIVIYSCYITCICRYLRQLMLCTGGLLRHLRVEPAGL